MNIENLMMMTKKDIIDTRAIAAFIDFIFISILTLVFTIIINARNLLIGLLIYVLWVLIYFTLFECLTGRTPGKFIFKLRVINRSCRKPNFIQAFIRALFWIIEVNPVSLIWFLTIFLIKDNRLKQRFGDRAADTFVVRNSDLKNFLNNDSIQTMSTDAFIYQHNKPQIIMCNRDWVGRILDDSTMILFEGDKKYRIRGIKDMTASEIMLEIQKGAEFVIFKSCASLIVLTERRSSDIYFVKSGENAFKYHWTISLKTFFLGWWSLTGIVWTIGCLITNFTGGVDVTDPVRFALEEYGEKSISGWGVNV